MDDATDRPDYVRPELQAYQPDLDLVDHLLGGTRAMWANAETYIRKWKAEADATYAIRCRCEELFEGLGRTKSAGIGMLFAKPPEVEMRSHEEELRPHWENLDGAGTAGHVLVKRLADQAMRGGISLILVDHPSAPVDPETGASVVVTAENEGPLGLRPRWAFYPRASIISWATDVVNSEETVVQVVLHEPTARRKGRFGVEHIDLYRVLFVRDGVAAWELWEKRRDGQDESFEVVGSGVFRNRAGHTRPDLPIAIAYAGEYVAPLVASIPLLGVAWMNLAHWKIATALRFYLELSGFPQPTVTGELANQPGPGGLPVPGSLKVGPMVVVHLKEGGKFEWQELTGSSISKLQEERDKREQQMAQLGMSFLSPDTRQQETAEAKRLDATAENSTLATVAQGVDDAVNLAWEIHCWYLGIDGPEHAPVFTLNRDFESTAMDHDTMGVYVRAVKDAGLPPRLLLEAWRQGGRIPPDADLDELEFEMLGQGAVDASEAEEGGTA